MLRAISHLPAGHGRGMPFDHVVLAHDERRLRRKLLTLAHGDEVMVDFPQTVTLDHHGALVLDDDRFVEVIAAEENLHEARARDTAHLLRLAWHIGNRHTPAQLEVDRVLIQRDHVLKAMLEGLGATVTDVTAPFVPEHGAYHGHSHGAAQGHADTAHALLYRK